MELVAEREAWAGFDPVLDKGVDDVLLPRQKFFVFQLAHADAAIKSADGRPWIRAIGFTDTLDAARELARSAHDMADKLETRIMPCGRNFLAARAHRKALDFEALAAEQEASNRAVDAWIEARKAEFEATHKRAEQKAATATMMDTGENASSEPAAAAPAAADTIESTVFASPFPSVFLQRVFAAAVIPDADAQPSVVPLFAMDDEDQMRRYLKTAARSRDLVHFDILVGNVGEWLPLHKPRAAETAHHHPLRQALEENIKFMKDAPPN